MSAVIPDPALTDWVPLGGVGGGGSMIALQEIVVPAGGQATFDFTNIPQTYRHLMVEAYARTTDSGLNSFMARFNGDAGANYDWSRSGYGGASINNGGSGVAQGELGLIPGTLIPLGSMGVTIHFPDYTNTSFRRTAHSVCGCSASDTAAPYSSTHAVQWRSNAAINRLTLFSTLGNLVAGSRATLYGIAAPITTLPLTGVRAVWGRINGTNGAILSGTGFSCVRTATGQYTITFNTPFTNPPAVTVSPYPGTTRFAGLAAPTTASVASVVVVNTTFNFADPTDLSFIAMEAA